MLLDNKNVILSINPSASKLFSAQAGCVGQNFLTLDRSTDVSQAIDRARETGHSETRVELSGRIYQFDISRIESAGEKIGAVLLCFDITERETAEQARREFTANVSHELKTPLTSISGFAELMKEGLVPPEKIPEFSGDIYKESLRLIGLVNDIIQLSRLDENSTQFQRAPVDLYDLCAQSLERLSTVAARQSVTLALTGEHAEIIGVEQLLKEMIYNLLDNAIKYNVPGGSVTASVRKSAGRTILSVADTGIGIPYAHQPRVFERFYRVDKSHSKEVGGTGLGLSIVRHAAQYHGARLELKSQPGKGTTITVTF